MILLAATLRMGIPVTRRKVKYKQRKLVVLKLEAQKAAMNLEARKLAELKRESQEQKKIMEVIQPMFMMP